MADRRRTYISSVRGRTIVGTENSGRGRRSAGLGSICFLGGRGVSEYDRGCCRTRVRRREMQGKKPFLDKEVTRFRLSERIPPHNLYRRLAKLVDWTFLYDQTRALYSHMGQPSLDPVVFFKLVLVGQLENLVSDRRLVEHCALRLDILLFLGYEMDEELPWHSTSSRTRQLFPAAVFERLFDHVFA